MARNGTSTSSGIDQLIAYRNPRSPVSEAYRTLRTNIQFSSLERSLNTIMVTSSGVNEDKSLIIANLAITIAQSGSQVILVDCDLRRPNLANLFGVPNTNGVTSVALEAAQTNATLRLPLQRTPVEGLRLLTSGPIPPNPSEVLASKAMDRILQALRAEADYVLCDTPPVIAVADAAVLARKVDGVLLVVSAGQTKRDHALRAKQQLEKVNARILGVVLNNAQVDKDTLSY